MQLAWAVGQPWKAARVVGQLWTAARAVGQPWTAARVVGQPWTAARVVGQLWTAALWWSVSTTAVSAGCGRAAVLSRDWEVRSNGP